MGKMGGDTRLKRQLAPTFWNIRRKERQFVLKASPGPHRKDKSYPLGIILRDVLNVANSMHEAKTIVSAGKIKIDGIERRDVKFPVGLMDVIELQNICWRCLRTSATARSPTRTGIWRQHRI